MRLEIAAHRGQRRLQLVRDVRQHLPAEAVGGAQRLVARRQFHGHPVERPRQTRHLVAAVLGRTRRQIAGAEACGGNFEIAADGGAPARR